MKILELEINKVRGIKNLKITVPQGKTFVVWGPNGTGKSGIIDSIDFLLTGQVTRLTGAGTGNLTLKKHGPHIGEDIKDAYVKAKVKLFGIAEPIEIRRDMANPNIVVFDKKYQDEFNKVFDVAGRGQHVLTRREILQYVTSESGTRADEIQKLLNINEIENIRKNFVKIYGKANKSTQSFLRTLEQAKASANSTMQERNFGEEILLAFINKNRAILNGVAINNLDTSKLKEAITAPKVIGSSEQNITLIEKDIANIKNILSMDTKKVIQTNVNELLINLDKISKKPNFIKMTQRKSLFEIGLKTIKAENTNDCPLCDQQWSEGLLSTNLTIKLDAIKDISEIDNQIEIHSAFIAKEINILNTSLTKIINLLSSLNELGKERKVLEKWFNENKNLRSLIEFPLENMASIQNARQDIERLFLPLDIESVVEDILIFLKERFPQTTPEQNAWDTLTRLEENIKAIDLAESNHTHAMLLEKRAMLLKDKFEESRDRILNELYGKIQDKFVDLYKQLHGDDEKGFSAKLEPKGAALNFEVDFHGRGAYPPHALHSEGHQDSMGLCLFLALADFLASGIVDVLLLDDVVMSVDAEHRRSLCTVLTKSFPNKQFVITTHDQTWASQLKTEGLVTSKTSIEFYNWDIETGPHLNLEQDIRKDIRAFLEQNDIPAAAAKLRRGAESFFDSMCDSLEAQVIYKQSRRWELGNFMPNAVSQYSKLLGKAKNAAQSWNHRDLMAKINEVESHIKQVYKRSNAEQWGINSSVHYNEWNKMSKNDFLPIVEAFEDLFDLFTCQTCKGSIKVVSKNMEQESLKCNCGKINWNLLAKK